MVRRMESSSTSVSRPARTSIRAHLTTTVGEPPRARGLLRSFAPPLIVWAIVIAGLVTVSVTNGFNPARGATWARWDSTFYLSIAAHGYDLVRCPARLHYSPGTFCGNAGWFPAYAWLIGAGHSFGLPLDAAGVAISWLFGLGTLLLLWATFLGRRLCFAAVGCLLFAAFVPGQIYDYAIFPLSMLAFFTVLHLWLLDRRRWLLAGLAGAVAAMTYPIGVLLAPVSALWILFVVRDVPWVLRLRRVALSSVVTAAGFAVVLVDMELETGSWDAYFKVQAKYLHGFHDPASVFRLAVQPALHASWLAGNVAPAVETLFVGVVLACIALEAAWRWRRLTARDALLLLWAAVILLFPLTQANLTLTRSQTALLPLGLLVLRLPRPLVFLIVCVSLWLSVPIAELFLKGALA